MLSRRRLLDGFLATSLGALAMSILYPLARFLTPPEHEAAAAEQVDAGRVDDPEFREKGYKIVRVGADPVIVIRVARDQFRAFSASCTHLDCIVEYRKSKRLIWCNCHNGAFDLHGHVRQGPPPRPLPPYDVQIVAGGPSPSVVITRRGA